MNIYIYIYMECVLVVVWVTSARSTENNLQCNYFGLVVWVTSTRSTENNLQCNYFGLVYSG